MLGWGRVLLAISPGVRAVAAHAVVQPLAHVIVAVVPKLMTKPCPPFALKKAAAMNSAIMECHIFEILAVVRITFRMSKIRVNPKQRR